ncbi:MAG: hypothetical protein K9N57_00330 [Candidatus Marinimicrobia bacterium]|nr:hypothetical protein [Candidatus Neomarinimicrobiota bacterium]
MIKLKTQIEQQLQLLEMAKKLQKHKKELDRHIEEIHKLQGLIPICVQCKNIRDDDGYWHLVEEYFVHHPDIVFSHTVCPNCKELLVYK